MERTADQFLRPLRPHPGRHPHFATMGPRSDPLFQRFDCSAAERDLGQMEFRHGLASAGLSRIIRNGLAAKIDQCGKPEETEEAGHIGDRRDEHSR